MVLPIYLFGHPLLKKQAAPIASDYPELSDLINDMWETMYNAHGVGLAAPQIGLSIRIFVVDTIQTLDDHEKHLGIKQVFINPQKQEEDGPLWDYEEGCLSIPNIRGDVTRPERIHLTYLNEAFEPQDKVFEGINARVIQHEYDHLEGELFVEKLKPIKKRRIQKKLNQLKKGDVNCDYRVKPYLK